MDCRPDTGSSLSRSCRGEEAAEAYGFQLRNDGVIVRVAQLKRWTL
jgi:hypothetical protein